MPHPRPVRQVDMGSDERNDDIKPKTSKPHAVTFTDTRAFYREKVLPLSVFMDENPDYCNEAENQVVEFFCICVTENRLSDAILLLRSIKTEVIAGAAWLSTQFLRQWRGRLRSSLDRGWTENGSFKCRCKVLYNSICYPLQHCKDNNIDMPECSRYFTSSTPN